MDIEKMNSKALQYYFGFIFALDPANIRVGAEEVEVWLAAGVPFHLRYGEANHFGRVLYKLAQTFDLATNCMTGPALEAEVPRLARLREIISYDRALGLAFINETLAFFNLHKNVPVQNFVVHVGNASYKWIVKYSTLVAVLYGLGLILYGVFAYSHYVRVLGSVIKPKTD